MPLFSLNTRSFSDYCAILQILREPVELLCETLLCLRTGVKQGTTETTVVTDTWFWMIQTLFHARPSQLIPGDLWPSVGYSNWIPSVFFSLDAKFIDDPVSQWNLRSLNNCRDPVKELGELSRPGDTPTFCCTHMVHLLLLLVSFCHLMAAGIGDSLAFVFAHWSAASLAKQELLPHVSKTKPPQLPQSLDGGKVSYGHCTAAACHTHRGRGELYWS